MTIQNTFYTVEQFEAFVERPENSDKLFEFIGGEIFEVPSAPYISALATQIVFLMKLFLHQNQLKGHITGKRGGYQIGMERYTPDVAYLPHDKQEQLATSGYNPVPPNLAVEVVSSDRPDELDKLRIKITNYLAVGTVVWVVKPDTKTVEVHQAGKAVLICREKDTLSGGDVLPDFEIRVADIFDV